MDELVIDEKKYISSKRAAKVTGYAKDYVGQLCREGRVPARLVGRGWYVLESALQDHRFGTSAQTEHILMHKSEVETAKSDSPVLAPVWESPRYKSLPEPSRPPERHINALEDHWQEWFAQVSAETLPVVTTPIQEELQEEAKEEQEERDEHEVREAEEEIVNEIVPSYSIHEIQVREAPTRHIKKRRSHRVLRAAFQITLVGSAVASAVVATLGSGYYDEYIVSFNRVTQIAGIAVYDK